MIDILHNAGSAASPVAEALADLSDEADTGGTAFDIVVTALNLASSAVGAVSTLLIPIGPVIAGLVRGSTALPGPTDAGETAALRLEPSGAHATAA